MKENTNDINQLIRKVDSLHNARVVKRFKSKKNTVFLISQQKRFLVLKWYQKKRIDHFSKEYKILSQLKTTFLKPTLLEKNDTHRYLLMEYISADNVCDLINHKSLLFNHKKQIILDLAHWFCKFHGFFQLETNTYIHGDANLRNFLYNYSIYGLDFEQTRIGKPIQDVSDICAFILTTTPSFTEEKKDLCHLFIETYEKKAKTMLHNVQSQINQSVQRIKKRRMNQSKMDCTW